MSFDKLKHIHHQAKLATAKQTDENQENKKPEKKLENISPVQKRKIADTSAWGWLFLAVNNSDQDKIVISGDVNKDLKRIAKRNRTPIKIIVQNVLNKYLPIAEKEMLFALQEKEPVAAKRTTVSVASKSAIKLSELALKHDTSAYSVATKLLRYVCEHFES